MKKAYSKSSRQGLPGGPNEMFQKVKGIIVSERGQWDFPGMNTLVPTQDGRITMRGVPYPVLGQDETGYTQMMYPEQEYQFPGQNVLELPMAQNGLSTPIINLPEYTVIDEKIPENIRLANTAKRLVEELYDVSRPAAGFTEKISDLFIPGEKKYYDNTCVKGVCDIFKEANLNSGIPEDVLNNKDFLENYSKYGFTLVPNEQLQVGDIIQYHEKDRPTHLGIYVGDDEYVGDGSKDKPLVKSNIHKYPDGKDKLPFRVFRKNFKSGGSLPKAQPGLQTENPNEVKYGTPEYEQAYNQGTLTTSLSGDPEDFVRARTLPEFKITPQYTSLRDDLSRAAVLGVKGAAELTGIPGTVRFAQNPVTSLKGAGNTLVDLGMTVGAFARMNPAGGFQYATQGVNPLTGEGSFRAEDVEGAFNTLDAVGTATVLGSALKAPVTAGMKQAVNTIPKGVVDYGKDLAYSIPRGKLPQYANAVRWQPDEIPGFLKAGNLNLTDEQKALKGSWYGYDPATFNSSLSNPNQKIDVLSGLGFYPQTRPGPGNVLVNRLSERQIRNLEKSMSPAAKGMSGKPKSVTVSDDYLQGELTLPPEIRNNPNMNIRFDVNPSEYLSPNYSNKDFSTLSLPEKTLFRKEIGEGVSNIINSNYQPIKFAGVSVPRKYFPFQDGGSLPKAQTLGQFNPQVFKPNPLTGRYNWEKPKAKPQLRDFEPKQKAAPRSSTSVATKSDPVKAARQINAAAAEEYERNRQGVIRATNRPVSVFRPGAGDPEAVMEFMGVPGAVRFVKSPVQSLKGAGNTIVDLGLTVSPFANMNPAAGFQYAKQGTNPLTGEGSFRPQDVEGAFNTLDAAGLATIVGAGLKAPLQQGLKQTGNIAKIGLREGVDLFHPVGRNLKRIEQEGISKGLSAQAIKNRQMQEVGITSLQREGYFPGVSEILSEYFVPYSYDNPVKRLLNIPKKIIKGDRNTKRLADLTKVILDEGKNTLSKPRYDAWRMYSGLPQKHGTFRIAETHPINHPSYTKNQLNNLEKFSLNNERKLLHQLPNEYDTFRFMYNDEDLIEAVPHLKEALKNINKLEKTGIDFPQSDFTTTNIMGGYNRRFFDNKMEYNDIWDLDLNGLKVDKYFGKPFMSHGQLEYSFEPARNAINTLLRRADILEKNINPFTKYNFDDINIKGYNNITYKDVVKPKKQLGGALPKAQVGDEIFPGEGQYYNIPEYTYNYKRGFDDLPDPVYSGPLMNQRLIDEATQREYEQRRRAIDESIAATRNPFSAERLAKESATTGDKLSLQMMFGDPYNSPRVYEALGGLDFINPAVMLGDMATGLGALPYNIQEGNYGSAALGLVSPLATGALASIGVKSARGFVNNLVNPFAGIGDTPKQLPGSPNAGRGFKSEIDWRNWVKYKEDFDNNPQVIQELIDIEKRTKADGTWMKNPDGSPFQGTPEQFVVQQSSKFKDAYKEGFETVWRGGDRKPELNTKYSSEGDVVFTTKDEYGGHAYNRADNPHIKLSDTDTPPEGLSKLYAPKTKNKIVIDGDNSYMSEGRLIKNDRLRKEYGRLNVIDQNPSTPLEKENLNTFINWMKVNRPGVDLKDRVMTDNFASFLNSPQGRNIDRVEFIKIYDGTEFPINVEVHNLNNKKQLKSMFGNILFDMSNPNIYKALAPIMGLGVVGTYGANQLMNQQPESYQDGGDTYNMQRALELGYTPDEIGHWPSVDSTNGMWLKSKQHPTAWMEYMYGYALNPENNRRFDVVPNVEGYFGENQLQYVPKKFGGSLPKFQVAGSTSLPTLYVDPNDPAGRGRYKAYQDSLKVYKNAEPFPEGFSNPNRTWNYWGSPDKGLRYEDSLESDFFYYPKNEDNTSNLDKFAVGLYGKMFSVPVYKKPVQPVKYKPNPEIVAKQQQLIDAGFDIGRPDGIWGKKSQAAWEELQNKSTPSSKTSAPSRNFRETISQVPYINPMTGETETRVVLRTPKDEFMMNLEQYGKLGADSIPKEGNYIFKRRAYAYGGPLQTDPVLNFITQQQPRRFSKSKK